MKNPENGAWYLLAYKGNTLFITVTRSPRGVVRAWHGYGDNVLATAGGWGYDKDSQVLAIASGDYMAKLGADKDTCQAVYNTGAGGVSTTKDAIAKAGGYLYDHQDAIGMVYDDIRAKGY
jgi:hypothetical protein